MINPSEVLIWHPGSFKA